jgi:hypothetical protein
MRRKPNVQFKLMVSEPLRLKIEREAKKKKISANAEAVRRLELSFIQEEYRASKKETEARDTLIIELLIGRRGDIEKGLMHAILEMLVEYFEGDTRWLGRPAEREQMAQKMGEDVTRMVGSLEEALASGLRLTEEDEETPLFEEDEE